MSEPNQESRYPRIDLWGRSALLLLLLVIFLAYLRDPEYSSIFDGLNLVAHEAGHLAFSYFGEFLAMAGGTLFELAIPLGVGVAFYRRQDFFGTYVVLFWLGTALVHVGVYMADARSRALGLVSMGGGEPLHDWYYLLGQMGLLRQDHLLGGGVRLCGLIAMAWGLWGGGRFVMERRLALQGINSQSRPSGSNPHSPGG